MDARRNSHWLKEAIRPGEEDCPSLIGDVTADVCIVGGGFTGLWTAINLKQQEPARDVVVLEKDVRGTTGATLAAAKEVGKRVAAAAKAKGVTQVVFDRGGYIYHGRVKALAEAAREAGLNF